MRLAVMGGTFNPIHLGHLISAAEVADQVGFDQVLFMPSAKPPHKSSAGLAAAKHRHEMVRLATDKNELFEASRLEIDRPGPSYARDTIRTLYSLYGDTTEVFWIIGADMLIDFHIWKHSEQLLQMCQFVATTRPSYDLRDVAPKWLEHVRLVTIPEIAISSTEIRRRVLEGRSIRYLVPDTVFDYIHRHRLYYVDEEHGVAQ